MRRKIIAEQLEMIFLQKLRQPFAVAGKVLATLPGRLRLIRPRHRKNHQPAGLYHPQKRSKMIAIMPWHMLQHMVVDHRVEIIARKNLKPLRQGNLQRLRMLVSFRRHVCR